MKKFLKFKYLLIVILAIIGIFVFLNYGFNIKNSKTHKLFSNLYTNYQLYFESHNNDDVRKYYCFVSKDSYEEYSFLDNTERSNYMHTKEFNEDKLVEVKGINFENINGKIEKKFFSTDNTTKLEFSNKTNTYIYTNMIKDFYESIENAQYYKKGYCTVDSKKLYFEEFKLKDGTTLKFLFENNELKEFEDSTNQIHYENIDLKSTIDNSVLESAVEKFNNFNS